MVVETQNLQGAVPTDNIDHSAAEQLGDTELSDRARCDAGRAVGGEGGCEGGVAFGRGRDSAGAVLSIWLSNT